VLQRRGVPGKSLRRYDVRCAQTLARPGRCVLYSASAVHRVTEVTAGERFTLTLWFTTRPDHDEDAKLLRALREAHRSGAAPPPPPPSMFALPGDATDLRLCRLGLMGLGLGRCRSNGDFELMHCLEGGDRDGVQVVLHWPTFQRWSGCPGASGREAAPLALLLEGVGPFRSAWHAVVGLQDWAWQHRGSEWGAEMVCSRHLSGGGRGGCAGQSCDWLRECAVQPGGVAAAQDLPAELLACVQRYLDSLDDAVTRWLALQRRWLQLGVIFPP